MKNILCASFMTVALAGASVAWPTHSTSIAKGIQNTAVSAAPTGYEPPFPDPNNPNQPTDPEL